MGRPAEHGRTRRRTLRRCAVVTLEKHSFIGLVEVHGSKDDITCMSPPLEENNISKNSSDTYNTFFATRQGAFTIFSTGPTRAC